MAIAKWKLDHIDWAATVDAYGYANHKAVTQESPIIAKCPDCSTHIITTLKKYRKEPKRIIIPRCQQCFKARASQHAKEAWANPEIRTKLTESIKSTYSDESFISQYKQRVNTAEHKQKVSAASTKLWSDPEYRATQTAAKEALWRDPEYRAKMTVINGITNAAKWQNQEFRNKLNAIWQTDALRDKIAESCKKAFNSDAVRNAIAARTSNKWQDDEYRNKVIAAVKSTTNKEEFKKAVSAISRAAWQNSDYRSMMIEAMKLSNQRPERKAQISATSKATWQSSEYRTKQAIARANQPRISSIQATLYQYLDDLQVEYYKEGTDTAIGWYAFDCKIPSNNPQRKHLLIECQGDYWHSLPRAIRNDRSKFTYISRYFPDHEIMYIWEHEFSATGRVLDRLKSKLGLNLDVIDFKFDDVTVRTPDATELKAFLQTYHYIGKDRGGKCFGAYLNNELIGVIVYSTPLRHNTAGQFGLQTTDVLELSRLCIHPCYHRRNFGSWLISRTIKQLVCKLVVSYADTTVGHIGTVYKASGFTMHHEVPPDYWYTDGDGYVMHKRTLYGKAKQMCMTEAEFAAKHGYNKTWGGSKLCFIREMNHRSAGSRTSGIV